MDAQHRVLVPSGRGVLRVVSLHGDYRYDQLKNTEAELQEQEAQLRQALIHDLKDHDLLVIGYSGRDRSLMNALHEAYSGDQAGRLYWSGMQDAPSPEVSELLALAQEKGHEAFYVPMHGFDDLIERLALRILRQDDLESAKSILSVRRPNQTIQGRFNADRGTLTSLVKSNAYPLVVPSEVLKADLRLPETVRPTRWAEAGYGRAARRLGDDAGGRPLSGDLDRYPSSCRQRLDYFTCFRQGFFGRYSCQSPPSGTDAHWPGR
jgi:hypothetical protein